MEQLFSPYRIGNLKIKNRFIRAATVESLVPIGSGITEEYLQLYDKIARGGAGLIITGNYAVQKNGHRYPNMLMIDKDQAIDELAKVVATVKKQDVAFFAQIYHGGRYCLPDLIGERPIAPSRVFNKVDMVMPRAMSETDIAKTIRSFGKAAKRAQLAGFDGVEINAAHGHLIGQFLSTYSNRRKDRWGGSLSNRMRFLLQIYKSARGFVGPDFPIIVKINCQDYVRNGFNASECIEVCKELDILGVDAVEISGGIKDSGFAICKGDIPMDLLLKNEPWLKRIAIHLLAPHMKKISAFEDAYHLPQAIEIKKNVKMPVIGVGGFRDFDRANKIIGNGCIDFVAMCRPFIRQPDIVNRLKTEGKHFKARCVNCNRCAVEVTENSKPLKCYYSPKENN